MKRLVVAVLALAVAGMVGCSMFGGGNGGGDTGPVQVTDYFIVPAGSPVALEAPTNGEMVVAEVNVELGDIEQVPEAIGGLIGNVQSYIVLGAQKTVPTPAPTGSVEVAMTLVSDSPVTIGDFYTLPAGTPLDIAAPAGSPALVLGVKLNLDQIEGVPENVAGLVPNLSPYIILGGTRAK